VRTRILKSLFLFNVIFSIISLLAFFSPRLNPTQFGPIVYLGLFYTWLWIGNVLFVLLWLFLRPLYALLSTGILVALALTVGVPFYLNPSKNKDAEQPRLTVGTYNLHGLITAEGRDLSAGELSTLSEDLGEVDILCVQETRSGNFSKIRQTLGYPYHYFSAANQLGIFSRYAILDTGTLSPGPADVDCIWALVNSPHGPVRVYDVYLATNRISGDVERLNETANIRESETWSGIGRIFSKYRSAATQRVGQVTYILEQVNLSDHPTVICGDFNDVPQSYAYTQLKANLKDAFAESGSGLGTTYNGRIPFLRIDYVLYNEKLKISTCTKLRIDFSDHFPIIASFSVNTS
jgi:endonuclease/exonuclease/phosphatase family metal-dependent hydrolase